jgi:hypothetical protein
MTVLRGTRSTFLVSVAVTVFVVGLALPATASTRISFVKNSGIVEPVSAEIDIIEDEYKVRTFALNYGFASVGAATGPGAVSAQSLIQVVFPPEIDFNASGDLTASASADSNEKIATGTRYCMSRKRSEALRSAARSSSS